MAFSIDFLTILRENTAARATHVALKSSVLRLLDAAVVVHGLSIGLLGCWRISLVESADTSLESLQRHAWPRPLSPTLILLFVLMTLTDMLSRLLPSLKRRAVVVNDFTTDPLLGWLLVLVSVRISEQLSLYLYSLAIAAWHCCWRLLIPL